MQEYSLAPHLAALIEKAEFRLSQAMRDQLAQYVRNSVSGCKNQTCGGRSEREDT